MERKAYSVQIPEGMLAQFLPQNDLPKELLPIGIDVSLFQNIKKSYEIILSMLWIEEKFNIIAENYYEWEQEIKESYDFFLYNQDSSGECDYKMREYGMSEIIVLNRRLNNLLSSIRLYQDQVLHQLSQFDNQLSSNLKNNFKNEMSKLYDTSVSYQIMEFVRNYMQHQGLIVERIKVTIPFNKNIKSRCDLPYFVEANYKRLQTIDNFNKKIKLKENLETQGEWINLIKLVREYFESIVNLHNSYRIITSKIFENETKNVYNIAATYYMCFNIKVLIFFGENEKDDFLIQYMYIDQLKKYRQEDLCVNLSKHYIDKKVYIDSNRVSVNNSASLKILYNMPNG